MRLEFAPIPTGVDRLTHNDFYKCKILHTRNTQTHIGRFDKNTGDYTRWCYHGTPVYLNRRKLDCMYNENGRKLDDNKLDTIPIQRPLIHNVLVRNIY